MPEQVVEKVELSVISDAITAMWCRCNDLTRRKLHDTANMKREFLASKRQNVLPQNLVMSRSREIGCNDDRIALKLDRHLGGAVAEVPVKFQVDSKSLNPNLAAWRLHEVLR